MILCHEKIIKQRKEKKKEHTHTHNGLSKPLT